MPEAWLHDSYFSKKSTGSGMKDTVRKQTPLFVAYYNLQIRLTLAQINLKYYVICKTHLPAGITSSWCCTRVAFLSIHMPNDACSVAGIAN